MKITGDPQKELRGTPVEKHCLMDSKLDSRSEGRGFKSHLILVL